jgi:hypothetical protein
MACVLDRCGTRQALLPIEQFDDGTDLSAGPSFYVNSPAACIKDASKFDRFALAHCTK